MARATITTHIALRGIAAVWVMCFHYQLRGVLPLEHGRTLVLHGWLLVDLFFVLSGFVLSYVYADELKAFGSHGYWRFMTARIARVYPLHLATLLTLVAFYGVGSVVVGGALFNDNGRSVEALVSNLLLVHAWNVHDVLTWNAPSWSISAEFAAYLAFPFVVFLAYRPGVPRWTLLGVAGAGYLCLAGYRDSSLEWTSDGGAIRALLGSWAGIGLYRCRHLAARLSDATLNAGQVFCIIALLLLLTRTESNAYLQTAAVFGFCALAWLTWMDRGVLAELLRHPALQRLGELSYAIYMIHYCLLYVTRNLDELATGRLYDAPLIYSWGGFAFHVAATVGLAMLSYRFVEMPARPKVRALLSPRRAVARAR